MAESVPTTSQETDQSYEQEFTRFWSKAPASEQLRGGRDQHQILLNQDGQQRSCVYCCHLRALAKLEGSDLPHVRKPKKMCLQCNVHLCTEHFSLYHGWEVPTVAV